jgi:ammonia channel protein AmtB
MRFKKSSRAGLLAFACGLLLAAFLSVLVIIGLRVDEETERDGLDFALHGETVQ